LTLQVRESAELQAADGSSSSTSLSPPLTGTFGVKAAPFIRSLVVDDPDGRDAIFGDGDTITVTFSEDTNTPPVAIKGDIDDLFTFSLTSFQDDTTADYTGVFVDDATVVMTIVDKGTCDPLIPFDCPTVGDFTVTVKSDVVELKDASVTSLASTDESPVSTGNFGVKQGPSILVVEAGGALQGVTDDDTIIITFSEDTNRPRVSTKADLDNLLIFEQTVEGVKK